MTEKTLQQYRWDWFKAENRAVTAWLKSEKKWKKWGKR